MKCENVVFCDYDDKVQSGNIISWKVSHDFLRAKLLSAFYFLLFSKQQLAGSCTDTPGEGAFFVFRRNALTVETPQWNH